MISLKSIKANSLTIACIIISILFPLGGLIVLLLLFSKKFNVKNKDFDIDIENDLYETNLYFLPNIDIEQDSDIISLEDSLEISDLYYRRKNVLDILKRDVEKYSSFLNIAINNEDTETTHYAATSILYKKRNLDFKLNKAKRAYLENPLNFKYASSYVELLTKQLELPYLDKHINEIYSLENVRVLINIVDNKMNMDQKYIIALIDLLLELNNNMANLYCKIFTDNYPYTEEKYLTLLRSFYVMDDYVSFNAVLLKLKEDNIPLSKEALNIVRFWLGG